MASAMPVQSDAPAPDPALNRVRLWARLGAEALGTFWLVFAGIGSAIISAGFADSDNHQLGIGFLGVALAVGLAVLTMAICVGHISGGHFNPAVSIGLACAGRFEWRFVAPYVLAQIVGGAIGSTFLFLIASGKPGFVAGAFASNGYDAGSPGNYSLGSAFVAELLFTAMFLVIIIAATSSLVPKVFAPFAIGLGLTLIHLALIPITNCSVNPARSIATALYGGPTALSQLWLFLVAPPVGAAIAGLAFRGPTGLRSGLGGGGDGIPEV